MGLEGGLETEMSSVEKIMGQIMTFLHLQKALNSIFFRHKAGYLMSPIPGCTDSIDRNTAKWVKTSLAAGETTLGSGTKN